MNNWRTIDSAPKEGWSRSPQVICGHSEKRWIRFGRYYGELKRWYYSGTSERTQWSETPGDAPTHWMPFPEMPPATPSIESEIAVLEQGRVG